MAIELFGVTEGLDLTLQNGAPYSGASILFGAGAPGGSGKPDLVGVGSKYFDITNGVDYIKKTAGAGADKWEKVPELSDLNAIAWRSKLKVVTADVIANGGTIDFASASFSDDDGPTLTEAAFVVGDLIISGNGGTEKLMRVSDITGQVVTFVDEVPALAINDNFVVKYYLPDPDGQENQAFVHYNGTDVIKLSDYDWEFANAINLTAGYAAVNGSITSADSVESAIQKLDGNQQDIQSSLGISQGAVDFGTFTGTLLADNQTAKQLFQAIETKIEELELVSSATGVTTVQVLDSVLVDDYIEAEWELIIRDDTDPTKVKFLKLAAFHNGHAGADAANVGLTEFVKKQIGANFATSVDVVLSGTGSAQVMQLTISATAAASFKARRTTISQF